MSTDNIDELIDIEVMGIPAWYSHDFDVYKFINVISNSIQGIIDNIDELIDIEVMGIPRITYNTDT